MVNERIECENFSLMKINKKFKISSSSWEETGKLFTLKYKDNIQFISYPGGGVVRQTFNKQQIKSKSSLRPISDLGQRMPNEERLGSPL